MKQKTGIRRLIEYIEVLQLTDADDHLYGILKEKCKELESVNEQQIKDGFNQGYREGENVSELMDMHDGDVSQFQDAEIYFKETFEKP